VLAAVVAVALDMVGDITSSWEDESGDTNTFMLGLLGLGWGGSEGSVLIRLGWR